MKFLKEIHAKLSSHASEIWCVIDDKSYLYQDLHRFSLRYGKQLKSIQSPIGVILRNDFETYASLITCWLWGRAYVPLNPEYPESRLCDILTQAGVTYIFDSKREGLAVPIPLTLMDAEIEPSTTSLPEIHPLPEHWAYILFTSGTTGKPKGVPISFKNLEAFFDGFFHLGYSLDSNDRFLNMFELTFDLSVMSFGIPTLLGASFYVPSENLIKPLALYDVLERHQITFALMVPSAVDLLAPYVEEMELPQLRITQFCGEALKLDHIKLWKIACPSTQIDNVYGPTEATIYCSRYTVPDEINECKHHHGTVCIGNAMLHSELRILEDGEIALGGQQITEGYLHATDTLKSKFLEISSKRYYKSGDLGSTDEGLFFCHGRSDDQIKIQGYRVELAEIEYVGSQVIPGISNRCIAAFNNTGWELHLVYDTHSVPISLGEINERLPEYMHIRGIHFVHPFPLNANGKIDKNALATLLNLAQKK